MNPSMYRVTHYESLRLLESRSLGRWGDHAEPMVILIRGAHGVG